MVAFNTWPVFRLKSGVMRSIGHRMPPGAMSVTSSAHALFEPHNVSPDTRTKVAKSVFFIVESLGQVDAEVRE